MRIPRWVKNHRAFREWAHSEAFPEKGQVCYFDGDIWIDMSKEQFAHNQVKGEISSVLTRHVKESQSGRFFPDGYLLSNTTAGLSTNPDGIFVSMESLETGRVRLVEGAEEGYVELEGAPEMVLEVVSASSLEKDTVTLRDLYWRAGIREYWLVDVRHDPLEFDILRHGSRAYVTVRNTGGWIKSTAFGKTFRLTQREDSLGYLEFTLAMR
jgi:Uma2 family endonuclease